MGPHQCGRHGDFQLSTSRFAGVTGQRHLREEIKFVTFTEPPFMAVEVKFTTTEVDQVAPVVVDDVRHGLRLYTTARI